MTKQQLLRQRAEQLMAGAEDRVNDQAQTAFNIAPVCAEKAEATLARLQAGGYVQHWEPIKTAPKDGTKILLTNAPAGFTRTGYWDGNLDRPRWIWDWEYPSEPWPPTHWASLPVLTEEQP